MCPVRQVSIVLNLRVVCEPSNTWYECQKLIPETVPSDIAMGSLPYKQNPQFHTLKEFQELAFGDKDVG